MKIRQISINLQAKSLNSIEYEVSENIKLEAPQVSYRDGPIVDLQLEDIGVLGQTLQS